MKFNITINEEEFIKFNLVHFKISQVGKRVTKLAWLISVMVVVLSGVVFFSMAKSDGSPLFIPIILTVFMALAMLVYMLFINKKATERSVLKSIKTQKKDGKLPFTENSVVEFADDEVIEESETGISRVKYDKLERLCVCDTVMYLYVNSQQAIILPYSQIGSEKDRIIALLKEKSNIEIING